MSSRQKSPSYHITNQGKITTENQELLSLLRENSTDLVKPSEQVSVPPQRSGARNSEALQPQRLMSRSEGKDGAEGFSADNTRQSIPHRPDPAGNYGSPVRSRRQNSADQLNVRHRSASPDNLLIDSLEVPRTAEELAQINKPIPVSSDLAESNDPLVDSLEVEGNTEETKYSDTEAKFRTDSRVAILQPNPIPLSHELIRPSSRDIQIQATSAPIELASGQSYSSRRLKGTDSNQRILLPIGNQPDPLPEKNPQLRSGDSENYDFNEKDTAPIRELLTRDDTPKAERIKSSQTYVIPGDDSNTVLDRKGSIKSAMKGEAMEPLDENQKRVYVDSPTFSPQEEEEYRFVNSRLDEYEEFKDNATYRELDRNALKEDKDINDSKNVDSVQMRGDELKSPPQKQYVLRPSSKQPSNNTRKTSDNSDQLVSTLPKHLFTDVMETSTEDSDLERERSYQQHLQERLNQQAVKDADIVIPRLNLPDESVEYVRDSLYEDDDTYRDTEKAEEEYGEHDAEGWVHPQQNPFSHPNTQHPVGRDPPAHQQSTHTEPVYQAYEGFQHGGYMRPYPQVDHYESSRDLPEYYDNRSHAPAYDFSVYDQQGQVYQNQPQDYFNTNHSHPPFEQQPERALKRYPTQTEAEYFIELPGTQGQDMESPTKSLRRPTVDYIEKNKQNAFRGKQGKSYGELKKKKSELEQMYSGMLTQNVPKRKEKEVRNGNISDEHDQLVSNPEEVWKNRSASLAHQKQGSGKAKGRKIGKLTKYPTDSRILPNMNSHIPETNPDIDRSALSTGNLSPSRRNLVLKPITQEVWTEDGQRISVDINLKLMSPPPGTVHPSVITKPSPLGPIRQDWRHQSAGAVIQGGQPADYPSGQMHMYHSPTTQMPAVNEHGHFSQERSQGTNFNGQPDLQVQEDFEKYRKHQHNVEQQQRFQQQLYQEQLARKHQLQQQLYQMQQGGQIGEERHMHYQQPYAEEDTYDAAYPSPRDNLPSSEMITPRQRHQNMKTSLTMNPYNRIPPITTQQRHRDMMQPKESPDGYVNQFWERKFRENQKPDYKVYTLDDYRKMQKEVRLGGLGPDLDSETYKDKAGKKIRQENYAREVMLRNKQSLPKTRPPVYPREKEASDILTKAQVAREYAKHIPKPKTRVKENQYNSYQASAQMSTAVQPKPYTSPGHSPGLSHQPSTPTRNIDVIDLQKLHERHQRDKENVALLRQNQETM